MEPEPIGASARNDGGVPSGARGPKPTNEATDRLDASYTALHLSFHPRAMSTPRKDRRHGAANADDRNRDAHSAIRR